MFTGIVEELGKVVSLERREAGLRLTVECKAILQDVSLGASIAVNGTCLSAAALGGNWFTADVAPETVRRTNLGDLIAGSQVNLERPLRANARLDGHFVLGHVDGTGEIVSVRDLGSDNWWLQIRVAPELTRYIVSKGSVAIDGISLTVAEVADGLVSFTIIPLTYRGTTLQQYRPGARVNVEVDILAKHLEKLVGQGSE